MAKKNNKSKDRVTVTLKKQIWKRLSKYKIDNDHRGFNETVDYLLKNVKKDGL